MDGKMNEQVKTFVEEKVKEMISAVSCCKEAKAAGQNWLDAVGTDQEEAMTKTLIAELEADIMTAEGLYAFALSEAGAKVFGEEAAKGVAAHAKALQESGAVYCDCPACAAVAAILEKKEELL